MNFFASGRKGCFFAVLVLASILVSNFVFLGNFVSGAVMFSDGFESGNFGAWTGTYRTSRETTSVVSSAAYAGAYDARYTSNGGSKYERAYSYRTVSSATELYARGYFNVSKSGIAQNGDYFSLLMFTAGSRILAYAGWKQNSNGRVCWYLSIRNGASYASAYSTSTPASNVWSCVELHWKSGSASGLGELYVNGALVCAIRNKNTAYYGSVNSVRFGLPEIYSCRSTTAYLDNAVISTTYIGPETVPVPIKYSLTVDTLGEGSTTPLPGTYQYDRDSNASFTAVPDEGSNFSHWLLNGTNVGNSNPYQLTMNANYNLTAVFTTDEDQSVKVGICPPSNKAIWVYEDELNVEFDHILQFQSVKSLNYSKIIPYLDRGYDVILNVEFQDSYANLKQIAAGAYDGYLTNLANAIKADGRTVWLRPLHEFNGDWYNWGTLYAGNTIADFVPAWKHVVQLFRDNDVPVQFQLNYNANNGKNDKTPFSAFYPGDEWVDMVVITCYNRADTDQYPRPWRSFAENFEAPYNQVVALTSKPIGVAETSSTSYSGNKSQWILDTFNSIAYNYPRVEQVTWFLVNKTVNGYVRDWDLNTQAEKDAFTQGMTTLQSVRR